MRKENIVPLMLAAVLLVLSLGTSAKADDWNKKTVVTFDQDVTIPDRVLPPGTYIFKLLNSASSRYIVQIWDQDEMHLITTLMTVGDSYPNPDGRSYFVLDTSQTEEGVPPAVLSWFFAGSDDGRAFIYPGYSTTRILQSQYSSQSQPEQ